jgi:hypothetical protein
MQNITILKRARIKKYQILDRVIENEYMLTPPKYQQFNFLCD